MTYKTMNGLFLRFHWGLNLCFMEVIKRTFFDISLRFSYFYSKKSENFLLVAPHNCNKKYTPSLFPNKYMSSFHNKYLLSLDTLNSKYSPEMKRYISFIFLCATIFNQYDGKCFDNILVYKIRFVLSVMSTDDYCG